MSISSRGPREVYVINGVEPISANASSRQRLAGR